MATISSIETTGDFVSSGATDILKNKTVVVHPIVLLSVVDHYKRIAKGSRRRVVGTILGDVLKNEIHVSNSFALPFEEDNSDSALWYVDSSYHETMYNMFRKINCKEKVLGWYSTGPRVRASDLEIHEVFRKFCPHPIYLIVDLNPSDSNIPTEAYISTPMPCSDDMFRKTFVHVPSVIGAYEAEEVGVEHLLRDLQNLWTSTLSTKIDDKIASIQTLSEKFGTIISYLDDILAKNIPPNLRVLHCIQNILNAIPHVKDEEFIAAYQLQANDMSLTCYAGALSKAIVALNDLVS